MRVSSFSQASTPVMPAAAAVHPARVPQSGEPLPAFLPFSQDAFSQARMRRVPVFLIIGDTGCLPADPSLCMQLRERAVCVQLQPGERPDIELLCQRAGILFSQEGALPLCALLLPDGPPFLAASLPPHGFALDPSRLYAWLSHADRRFSQNPSALNAHAAQVFHSFRLDMPKKPYSPKDAAHDLSRALCAVEDRINGGFGRIKSPFVCGLSFLQHAAARGEKTARSTLSRTLDVMLASPLFDPIDGSFFRGTLTQDWRVFIPEKPLGINAMLARILLDSGRRSEAIRLLDFIASAFSLQGGALSPALRAEKAAYSFSTEQVCAALGHEDGLRACRLLGLLHRHAHAEPSIAPSRFSPLPPQTHRLREDNELPALFPVFPASPSPEDAAFLRRALPILLRSRSARTQQQPLPFVLTEHCALAAAILAQCGKRLGEPRYTQAAQRAVAFLISQPPVSGACAPLPASLAPVSLLQAQASCGAASALALAQLTLGQCSGMESHAQGGLRLLGAALHAFVRKDGMPMHTPDDPAAFLPRMPAVYDSELPSPAALLVRALHIADQMRPQAGYNGAAAQIWLAAAPAARAQPLSCAALIDAMTEKSSG